MALYDIDGTTVGQANVDGSLAVLAGLIESLSGGSSVGGSTPLIHDVVDPLVGQANVTASTQAIFNMSGFLVGAGALVDARLLDVAGLAVGGGTVSADLLRIMGVSGYLQGGSQLDLSVPEPIFGVAVVTAYMEVIHVPPPVCGTPQVTTSFRWGHQFGRGDLDICLVATGGNPVSPICISYTLCQMVRGCQLIQVGGSRKPGQSSVGCYYTTGTAGECGQPGLWAIKWSYQRTYGDPVMEKLCYFTVLDSVLSPVPGDTLQRNCKYGWD